MCLQTETAPKRGAGETELYSKMVSGWFRTAAVALFCTHFYINAIALAGVFQVLKHLTSKMKKWDASNHAAKGNFRSYREISDCCAELGQITADPKNKMFDFPGHDEDFIYVVALVLVASGQLHFRLKQRVQDSLAQMGDLTPGERMQLAMRIEAKVATTDEFTKDMIRLFPQAYNIMCETGNLVGGLAQVAAMIKKFGRINTQRVEATLRPM